MVDFFSRERGRLKGIAKGGRRSTRRFANALDLFCLTDLEYEEKRGDICLLHSGRLLNHFGGIRKGYERLATASYFVELTEILFPVGVADGRMFDLLEGSLKVLDEGKEGALLRAAFEAGSMAIGGFAVSMSNCCICGRSYEGKGRAVFLPGRGAIACLRCERETPNTPGLSPAAARFLMAAQKKALDPSLFDGIGPPELDEVRNALSRHMDYRLGKRPGSGRFLA
jgi:DNA repair protein RecO (recombination protein O)